MNRVERLQDDILEGPIIKTLLVLGWPVMLSNVFQMLYNLVDTYWLGKIGKEAVAAPTVGFPIVFLLISLGFGFSIAGVALVSQHTGAGSSDEADHAAGQVISFMFLASIILGAIGFFVSKPLLGYLMDVPEAVFPKALIYIRIIFAGLPLMFIFFGFRALSRGVGNMVTPMILTGISIFVNVVLDPVLIFGWWIFPEMGVAGAAIATVFSRALVSFMAFYLMFSGKVGIHLKLSYLKLKLDRVKQIISIGGPSAVGQAGTALGAIILMGLISRLGVVAVSAYGIGQRIISMLNVVIWGFSSPLTTMIGQNIGAEKINRAKRVFKQAFSWSFIIISLFGGLVFLARKPIFQAFIQDAAVIEEGAKFLAIFTWSIPFFGIFALSSAVFRGSGHTKPPMFLSLVRLLIFRVGISYLLAFGILGIDMGTSGIWWGLSSSNILAAFLSISFIIFIKWEVPTIEGKSQKKIKKVSETAPVQ